MRLTARLEADRTTVISMKRQLRVLIVAAWGVGVLAWVGAFHPQAAGQAPPGFVAGTESGFATFQTQCAQCHGNPNVDRAPTPTALREMTPEKIYDGADDRRDAAAGVGPERRPEESARRVHGRPSARQREIRRRREHGLPVPHESADVGSARGPAWNGWSPDLANTRFQPANVARLTAAQVPKLKLKWAFGFPSGVSANAQPTIAAGRVFVGSDNGFVYSMDAKTGCVYWSFETGSIIRNAVVVGAVTGAGNAKYAAFVGDGHANVYAHQRAGRKAAVEDESRFALRRAHHGRHPLLRRQADRARLVVRRIQQRQSRLLLLHVARVSVVALDASTGKQIWKAWVVPDEPKPYKTMANGVVLYAPAGGAVWNSPTIDPVKRAVYFGTGDATTAPPAKTTDAIMAVDLDTGQDICGRIRRPRTTCSWAAATARTSARRARSRWARTWTSATRRC